MPRIFGKMLGTSNVTPKVTFMGRSKKPRQSKEEELLVFLDSQPKQARHGFSPADTDCVLDLLHEYEEWGTELLSLFRSALRAHGTTKAQEQELEDFADKLSQMGIEATLWTEKAYLGTRALNSRERQVEKQNNFLGLNKERDE